MARVLFRDTECTLNPGESVLDGLVRHGFDIPSSCRSGVCQTCVMQVTAGEVPGNAQNGLKDTWKQRGYFMPCVCRLEPDAVLEVQTVGDTDVMPATVVSVDILSRKVARLRLRTEAPFLFEPGQFITLIRERDDLRRSYSLASLPDEEMLELHVQRWPGGLMSNWIHDEVKPGQRMFVRGPQGECFYTQGHLERPLLIVGTGTGLAPLWGIVRHALRSGHRGRITFVHRAHSREELYMHDELLALAREHATIKYVPCVRGGGDGLRDGSVDEIAHKELLLMGPPRETRAYICGNPTVVHTIRRLLFLAGMSIRDIFCDAFISAVPISGVAQSDGRLASSSAA